MSTSFLKSLLKKLSVAAKIIEIRLLKKYFDVYAPIFIVGPARSGTTLIYQALTYTLPISYLPQFVTLFPRAAIFASALWKNRYNKKAVDSKFYSYYGKSDGLNGISQGHEIWSIWFKWKSPGANLSDDELTSFSQTIKGLSYYLGSPLAIKWPGFAAHLKEITRSFPGAFFIFSDRDTISMARSIYKGRVDLTGDPRKAISRSPDGRHLNLGLDPIIDILAYIDAVRKEIESVCENLSPAQYQFVKYEDLCLQPEIVMDKIRSEYNLWAGTSLSLSEKPPKSFTPSQGPSLPDMVESQLRKALSR